MTNNQIFVGSLPVDQRTIPDSLIYKMLAKNISGNLRVAMPGIVASFDVEKQTCTVDISVYDRIQVGLPSALANYNASTGDIKIPTLIDVPIVFPRAGGMALTFPVVAGDECLIIFTDMCWNEWFDAGGINNVQQVLRRHDLSDAFAILGPWSQPRTLTDYSLSGAELRTEDGNTSVGIAEAGVTLKGTTVTLDGLLALTGVGVPSVSSASISLPVKLNGVTYYLKLSTTP